MKNRFIDLFAGIGGFHIAANANGLECVMASEIDDKAQRVYYNNFKMLPKGDIYKIKNEEIPNHEWLFGGFPCQPFSNAGKGLGLKDERGNLFFEIERFIKVKKPLFIVLENVPGLLNNDSGNTWEIIHKKITNAGYFTPKKPLIFSPEYINIPQKRKRLYIIAINKKILIDKEKFTVNEVFDFLLSKKTTKAPSLLEKNLDKKLELDEYKNNVIDAWIYFEKHFSTNKNFTVNVEYFFLKSNKDLIESNVKTYEQNKHFYEKNKTKIDLWLKKYNVNNFYPSHKKFEWRTNYKIIDNYLQFRPSGLRIISKNLHPTLTTISSQILIDPINKRKISLNEAKKLQSFPSNYLLDENNYNNSIKQLGNAVNVKVVEYIIEFIKNKYEK